MTIILLCLAVLTFWIRPNGCMPTSQVEFCQSLTITETCLNLSSLRRNLCDSFKSNTQMSTYTDMCNIIICRCPDLHLCLRKSANSPMTSMTINKPTSVPTTEVTENMTSQSKRQLQTSDVYMPTSKQGSMSCQCKTQLAMLGVLVGLLMTVLVVMTTGWVWTCWMMKKRETKREIQLEQDRENHDPSEHQLHIPIYGKDNNDEQFRPAGQTNNTLYQPEPAAITAGVNNHHCVGSRGDSEEKEKNNHENVYHILENPAGDSDDYEELDKYEKQGQNNQEENVYHVLDGPTVVEEKPGGVATSTDTVSEEQKVPVLSTDVSN